MDKKLVVILSENEHKNFKLVCTAKDLVMSEIVRKLIKEWMAEQLQLEKQKED